MTATPSAWLRSDGLRNRNVLWITAPAMILLGVASLLGESVSPENQTLRNITGMAAMGFLAVNMLILLLTSNVRAVGRHTFAQCLRMKIAVTFIVLLAVVLAILPFVMKGDGTLAGKIRTFLSYGVSLTSLLLSLVTVLVAAGLIAGDVQGKQIYLLAAKPLARWEYLLGRWGGVLLFNAVLLIPAGVSIYLISQHLRSQAGQDPEDRRVIETDIFTARKSVPPLPPDYAAAVRNRIEQLKTTGRYETALEEYQNLGNLSRRQAETYLGKRLLEEAKTQLETAGPYRSLTWRFEGLRLDENEVRQTGTVQAVAPSRGLYRIAAPRELLGKLVYGGPIQINGIRGRVRTLSETTVDVVFSQEEQKRSEIEGLSVDASVSILVEPTFQFRYAVKLLDQRQLATVWRVLEFRRPDGAVVYYLPGETPVKTPTTVSVPAVGELKEGNITVVYRNLPRPSRTPLGVPPSVPSVQISSETVSLLYRAGGFEVNFLQAMLLIFVQLAFLAALAMFLGSFLSFFVAALSLLVLFGAGMLVGWLAESVAWGEDPLTNVGVIVVHLVRILMPRFSDLSPSDRLVDGLSISWKAVQFQTVLGIATRAGAYLMLGCWIFHRRELARVQV